jgi:diaminohydroxyphosphoribosylaminopyrimidine deaminase/5-amino-6-(5-phosphoribosylamino)uracil reductase
MRTALAEGERGVGRTSPNPPVGAVVVRDGRVVGRGHHERAGGPHAEVVALRAAGGRARGADLYTTLEPCDHWGKTPPCSIAVLEAGIRRVFVGSRDPNPVVNGRGIARLRREGVPVLTGVLRAECDALIAPRMHFMRTGRPFVTLKAAITLDGKIATHAGHSRWVTGPAARAEVHQLRDRVDAVLVGAETARLDDPRLTTRLPRGRGHDPLRVVLEGRRPLPRTLRLFHPRSRAPTLVATVRAGAAPLPGVETVRCRARRGLVDLHDLLERLAARGVTHLLVEGGATTHAAFLEAGLADRVLVFIAPKLLGGGRPWLAGRGPGRMDQAILLRHVEVRRAGQDLVVGGALVVPAPARRSRSRR